MRPASKGHPVHSNRNGLGTYDQRRVWHQNYKGIMKGINSWEIDAFNSAAAVDRCNVGA